MPLYISASYNIKEESVKKVKKAIQEFTAYVKKHEPGTLLYAAWQNNEDPTKFMHFFIFQDEEAKLTHSTSEAVKKFELVYAPNLVHGPVVFTNFTQIASNQ